MHAWVRRALCAVGLTGGIVLLGIGLAEAASADGDSGPVTNGQNGILSGNQTGADAKAPTNLSGNQITVIGQNNKSGPTGGSSTAGASAGSGGATTSGQDGIGSGNQTGVGVQVPVNVSGNQVTVIGQDNEAGSTGGSTSGAGASGSGSSSTSGEDGIGSGNQTGVGVQVPVNVSGNQVTVIGQDNAVTSTGGSTTGGSGGSGGSTGGSTTSGQDGIVSGNQTGVAVLAPVAATGNQVTVVGQDNTVNSTGSSTTGGGSTAPGQTTTGEGGVGSGNQTPIAAQAPVNGSDNQVTVVGQDNTVTSTSGSSSGGTPAAPTTPGGVVSPPGAAGGTASGPQGGGGPGETVLPNTGAPGDLLGLGVLGLMLLSAGLVLGRPRRLTVR